MSVPTLGPAAVNAMFLPNCKGMLKRDNQRRAKAHRMALLAVQGHVDTREPLSMQFSRGQKVDMKKLRQEAARAEYVEKCNRKLVDKMMMIMQGLCGTIASEQRFPDFNPGTLNYRLRHRELLRIDRANLALMHRLENASSGYSKEIVKPKHFQEPHMGLFPRSEQSVKSAGSKSRKRARSTGPSTTRSSGHNGELEWGASVSSALTEASSFPTLTLGKFHDAPSRSSPLPLGVERQDMGSKADYGPGEMRGSSPGGLGGDDGDASVSTAASWPTRTPHPPSISSRATCGSTSGKLPSTLQKCRRLMRVNAAKPGAMVFQGGVRIGDEYAMMTVTRATEGFGEDGTQGFRMKAYCPLSVAVYSLGISASDLPVYTSGSHTAVRRMFQAGEKSRKKWEGVAGFLELRPSTSDADLRKPVEKLKASSADPTTTGSPPGTAGTVAGSALPAATPVALIGLDGTEETEGDTAVALVVPAAVDPPRRLEMVLVPPEDAPVVIIQRLVRGLIARDTYARLKRSIVVIQAAVRGWKYRMAEWKHSAATKIAAVTRGKRCRERVKQERAARGIQKRTRLWLRKRELQQERAAKQIQFAIRRRNKRRAPERCLTIREESLPMPTTVKAVRLEGSGGGGSRPRQGRSRRTSTTTGGSTGGSDRAPIKRVDISGAGGGGRRGGRKGVETTASLRHRGSGGGGHQGRGKVTGKAASVASCRSEKGGELHGGGGGGGSGGGGGGAGSVDDRSRRHHSHKEADGSKNCSTPTAGGASDGANGGVESVVSGQTTRTPPRNQRPRPPDGKDFTRSPYNRTRAGWSRVGGGASTRTNKFSPSSSTGSPRPTAPSRSSAAPSDSQKHHDDRPPGGEKRPPGCDSQGEDISVAPPPSPKSSAAPRVAGAWPSGGAGTRTAKAAAEIEAASTATTPSPAAAGTKKVAFAARQGSPRSGAESGSLRQGGKRRAQSNPPAATEGENRKESRGEKDAAAAMGGNQGSTTAGEDQQQNEPSLEAPETARSCEEVEYNGTSHGEKHGTNRQQRSSSIPWVEEAAVGKHYQPLSTKLVAEAETGRDPSESTRRPSSDPHTAGQMGISSRSSSSSNHNSQKTAAERRVSATRGDSSARGGTGTGDGNDDPKRRTSSVSWAENIVAGNEGDRLQQESPQELAKSPRDSSVKASTVKQTANSSPGASGTSDFKNVDEDKTKRRASSVSWVEEIAEGKDGDTQLQQSPPEEDKSAAEASTEISSGATSKSENIGGSGNNVKRRTSSVSWAEDIVAGNGGEGQPPPPPLQGVKSAVDASVGASGTETTAKASPGTRSNGDDITGVDEGDREPKRRTSSVSWAEDIVEGKEGAAQPQPTLREKGDSALHAPHRRTSSISWAKDIVADQEIETHH